MQNNKITYSDYSFLTNCIKELENANRKDMNTLKIKIKEYIYNNSMLKEYFNTRVNVYQRNIENKNFISNCKNFRTILHSFLPDEFSNPLNKRYTLPAYLFYYEKELNKILVKHDNIDIPLHNPKPAIDENRQHQKIILGMVNDADGIYNFFNKILQYLSPKVNNEECADLKEYIEKSKPLVIFEKKEEENLYNNLDFYIVSLERYNVNARYSDAEYLIEYISMKKVLYNVRAYTHNYLYKQKKIEENKSLKHRLVYYESKTFTLNGENFLTNSPALTDCLYSVCVGKELIGKPKSISGNMAKINTKAEKIINKKILHSQKDRITKKTKYVLNDNIAFRDKYDEHIEKQNAKNAG